MSKSVLCLQNQRAKHVGHRHRGARRPLLLLPAFVVGLSLAITGAASAQGSFEAVGRVNGPAQTKDCMPGAFFCGTAILTGYGAASWDLFVVGNTIVDTPCGSMYAGETDFTLASDPSSTLVLDESGNLCGLGHDGAAYNGFFSNGPKANGNPFAAVGSWTTATTDCTAVPGEPPPCSTGVFAGLPGSGTDRITVAGLQASGTYSGTLG